MKIRPLYPLVLAILWFLTACAPVTLTPPPDRKTPLPNGLPTPTLEATLPAPMALKAVANAQVDLASRLDLPSDSVALVQVEPTEWPNACLGLPAPGEACAEVLTPGYRIVLQAGEQTYVYRSDLEGTVFRLEENTPAPGAYLPAVEAARRYLAEKLAIGDPASIKVIQVEETEWPDACLGVTRPGEMCAQVITPGFRITLEAQGKRHILHTNQSGSVVRQAKSPRDTSTTPLVRWRMETEDQCLSAEVSLNGILYGPCDRVDQRWAFTEPQFAVELSEWVNTFASFEAETLKGWVALVGKGKQVPAPVEQRALASWVAGLVERAQSPEPASGVGLLLTWRRSGGIAGLCNLLEVYDSGWAMARDCRSGRESPETPIIGLGRLPANALEQLYAWSDSLGTVHLQYTEGVADGFSYELTLNGRGQQQANSDTQQTLWQWAAALYQQLAGTP